MHFSSHNWIGHVTIGTFFPSFIVDVQITINISYYPFIFSLKDRLFPYSQSPETYPPLPPSPLYTLSPAAPPNPSPNWSACRKYKPSVPPQTQ